MVERKGALRSRMNMGYFEMKNRPKINRYEKI